MNQLRLVFSILFLVLIIVGCHPKKADRSFSTTTGIEQNSGDVVFGNNNAPETIFLYASYNCKYCRFFFSRTYPALYENYLQNGKVKLVVKWVEFGDNPKVLYSLQAASCIYQFGIYDKFHELLLINPGVVFTNEFTSLIDDIMKDNENIAQCILSNNDFQYIKNNVKEFKSNNLSGTPYIVLNNHAYKGFISYDDLKTLINIEFNL